MGWDTNHNCKTFDVVDADVPGTPLQRSYESTVESGVVG